MTLEELVSEEKKTKSQQITTAVFIGVLVGIIIWAVTHKGGFVLAVILLLLAFRVSHRNSQNLKSIQAEISRRNTAD